MSTRPGSIRCRSSPATTARSPSPPPTRSSTDWVRDHLLRDIETVARSHFGPDFKVEIAGSGKPPEPGRGTGATGEQFAEPPDPSRLHVRPFRHRPIEPVRRRRRRGGRGPTRSGLQPALPLRRLGSRQDPPPARDRPPGRERQTRRLQARVVYMTTEQFVNELINCIRRKQMEVFRQTFRGGRHPAARRHPVHRRQGAYPGGVLPHLQHAAVDRPPGGVHLRRAAGRHSRASRSACARASSRA